ncbi:MAG: hypothetical protein AAGH76_14955 [Pseudomonadota bacterium]
MELKIFARYLAVAVVAASLAFFSSAQSASLSNFKITLVVDSTQNAVKMECAEGCAWETLSFSCDSAGECGGTFDAYGTPAE